MDPSSQPLRVFLCHSSGDKPLVRELYQKLSKEGWIDIWLDEEKLLPGQDWDYEIEKALDASDAVIVTLSRGSVSKEGYIQKELRFVLDLALEKPEGTIFILPVRLDDCERPRRLRSIQGVDYFPKEQREWAYTRLRRSLELRARRISHEDDASEKSLPMSQLSTAPSAASVLESQTNDASPDEKAIQSAAPPSIVTAAKPEPQTNNSSQDAKPRQSTIPLSIVATTNLFWKYGRFLVMFLLLLSYVVPWTGLPDAHSNSILKFSGIRTIGEIFPVYLTWTIFGLLLLTLLRAIPWKLNKSKLIVNLERLAAAATPIIVVSALYWSIPNIWFWGYWLFLLGIYLAPVNILMEMRLTLQQGQKWPSWARLIAASIILSIVLLYSALGES